MEKNDYGRFCAIFGNTARNRIIEFLLEAGSLDFSPNDIAEETEVSRAMVYNICKSLEEDEILVKSRTVSNIQLYKLNQDNPEVKLLFKVFDMVLDLVAEEESIDA